jgi:predicted AAA+ superfamily ATPase
MKTAFIGRRVYSDLRRELAEPQVLVLVGPRQVGKTTLLQRLEADARESGKRTRYFDLEQPGDLARLTGSASEVLDALTTDVDVVLVEEFYYLEDAGRLFKAIYDRSARTGSRLKVVISGSSSIEVHSHLRESLAGRRVAYRIFPMTWSEFSDWDSPERPSFEGYLRHGGLPGLSRVREDQRKERLLQDYLSTYLFKDIKGLVKEENVRAFNHLLYLLAQNQGQLVEASSLARELGVSVPTVSNYLDVLDKTYVNYVVSSYHSNLANELKKSRKTYLYDLGIRNSILKDFRPASDREDRGAIFESYVLLELLPLLDPSMELRFWRTKKKEEVDFVLIYNRQPTPIEVKSQLDRPTPPSGLRAFCRRYRDVTQTFTVSAASFPTIEVEGRSHHFLRFEQVPSILDAVRG